MKKLIIVSSVLSLAFGSATYAAPSISANAKVRIVPAISIAESGTDTLNFGSVIPAGTSGSVAITASASPVRTPTTVTVIPASTFGSGVFNVTGDTTATYAITLPANGVVTVTGPGTAMDVNNFVSTPSGTGTLTAGAQTLYVGATLTVGANQTTGTYSGSYTVAVAYN